MPSRTAPTESVADAIAIRHAREHNLKGVSLDIPKRQLVVFSGVSGSGKSSLAFDTIFAEGQRRYVESLSTYARQFLGQLERPHVESIRGLSPTIAIEQKTASGNPRSTVGTVTEVHDYLRVLFARAGTQHCPQCHKPVERQDPDGIVADLLAMGEGRRVLLLAPLARRRKGAFKEVFEHARADGFRRVRIDGEVKLLETLDDLPKTKPHDVDLVIDRVTLAAGDRSRLAEAVELGLRRGEGRVLCVPEGGGNERLFSERAACDDCGLGFDTLTPRHFSFNSPVGLCPACNGLGTALQVDPDKVVPDATLSLSQGAVATWKSRPGESKWRGNVLDALAREVGIDLAKPWNKLPKAHRDLVLYGSDKRLDVRFDGANFKGSLTTSWEGVAVAVLRLLKETQSKSQIAFYQSFLRDGACPECAGTRLGPQGRNVRVDGATLPELSALPVSALRRRLDALRLDDTSGAVATPILVEVRARLGFLEHVGLGYLSLDRGSATLSGGEAQRVRLASQVGSELTGVIYVLDEPSVGLHPRDSAKLIDLLEKLRDTGNTVLVVEHDRDTLLRADHVVEFGPGAGRHGGEVLYEGPPQGLAACERSLTGDYLAGRRRVTEPRSPRTPSGTLTILGARENNLKDLDVTFPLGVLVAVTGPSGAGKSSLVGDILYPALASSLNGATLPIGAHRKLTGLDRLDKVVEVDQKPIGRTPRSNPATYAGGFDDIRSLFSGLPEARVRGFGPGRFSFNVHADRGGGRCERCEGDGTLKVEMHFLPDVWVTCPRCAGRRFNEATLEVKYRGRSIADVLDGTVDEAFELFSVHRKLARTLGTLREVGLGYLALGQPATTLSGGEAQRVKLSRELARAATGRTLYVLDEPTTGLHFEDVRKLLGVLDRLVDAGNTVVVIEHHPDVIAAADWIVDLGPEGGADGGRLVVAGTPKQVAACEASPTGAVLRGMSA